MQSVSDFLDQSLSSPTRRMKRVLGRSSPLKGNEGLYQAAKESVPYRLTSSIKYSALTLSEPYYFHTTTSGSDRGNEGNIEVAMYKTQAQEVGSWCFELSQPQRITSGLKEIFRKAKYS